MLDLIAKVEPRSALNVLSDSTLLHLDQSAAEFQRAKPFRYVVIDNFLDPKFAERLLQDFPTCKDPSKLLNEFGTPNPKSHVSDVRSLGGVYAELDRYIQKREFLDAIETVSGIKGLEYDPWYYGAGTHENFHGAGLDAHYDFNIHPRTNQHRRLNAIVYLNKDWDPAWGGAIRFHTNPWDIENDQIVSVEPIFNRCTIFETTERSWHSVPRVDLPPDKRHLSRKSFTIYLYTETRPPEELAPEHGTVYVQAGIPKGVKPGAVLSEPDYEAIKLNLQKRQSYLKELYKREYKFSAAIDNLKSQVKEWMGASRVPVVGPVKLLKVEVPVYPDGWLGVELRFSVQLLSSIDKVTLTAWRPDNADRELIFRMKLGSWSSTARVARGGMFDVDFEGPGCAAGEYVFSMEMDGSRVASELDTRALSAILSSIRFFP